MENNIQRITFSQSHQEPQSSVTKEVYPVSRVRESSAQFSSAMSKVIAKVGKWKKESGVLKIGKWIKSL
jgi:hypothetical protein